MNVYTAPKVDRPLTTGLHTVSDLFCCGCDVEVGWYYVHAYEPSQRYKENKFILVENKILKDDDAKDDPAAGGGAQQLQQLAGGIGLQHQHLAAAAEGERSAERLRLELAEHTSEEDDEDEGEDEDDEGEEDEEEEAAAGAGAAARHRHRHHDMSSAMARASTELGSMLWHAVLGQGVAGLTGARDRPVRLPIVRAEPQQ